eukprot:1151195-Pelagomonas_calceolata.AAC.7
MVVTHLPYGPSAYFGIYNTVLRHDIGQKKEVRMRGDLWQGCHCHLNNCVVAGGVGVSLPPESLCSRRRSRGVTATIITV